jgi:hypothetical protein
MDTLELCEHRGVEREPDRGRKARPHLDAPVSKCARMLVGRPDRCGADTETGRTGRAEERVPCMVTPFGLWCKANILCRPKSSALQSDGAPPLAGWSSRSQACRKDAGYVVIPVGVVALVIPAAERVLVVSAKSPHVRGHHVVIVQCGGARESRETGRGDAQIADRLLSLAEQVLPGLQNHLTFIETDGNAGGHPTVHRMGPIYGWALTPTLSGPRRLAPRTPADGLLLAGQWTQPGHGIFSVVQSGIQAARLTLGAPTAAPPVPLGLSARTATKQPKLRERRCLRWLLGHRSA